MICKYSNSEILSMINKQLDILPPPNGQCLHDDKSFLITIERLNENFSQRTSNYFNNGIEGIFKPEHTVEYMTFLYLLSNQLYKDGQEDLAARVYYLNKVMHSNDWFYAVNLPLHFSAEHPLGTVMGRAEYGDYFFFYQGCTVGGNICDGKLEYPKLGHHVLMYSDSKVLGKSNIGNYIILSANSYVINEDVPDNSIVFGQSPNLIVKSRSGEHLKEYFKRIWIS